MTPEVYRVTQAKNKTQNQVPVFKVHFSSEGDNMDVGAGDKRAKDNIESIMS